MLALALWLFFKHIHFQPYLYLCATCLSGLGFQLFYKQYHFSVPDPEDLWNARQLAHGDPALSQYDDRNYYAELEFEAPDGSNIGSGARRGFFTHQAHRSRYPVRTIRRTRMTPAWKPCLIIAVRASLDLPLEARALRRFRWPNDLIHFPGPACFIDL